VGGKKTIQVFGRGLLDTLDDAFWMLPFSSKKEAITIRQDNGILDETWQTRRDLLAKEHKQPDARKQLADKWKMWIGQDTFLQRREAAKAKQQDVAQLELPEYDD
jgi:hypothetical protein